MSRRPIDPAVAKWAAETHGGLVAVWWKAKSDDSDTNMGWHLYERDLEPARAADIVAELRHLGHQAEINDQPTGRKEASG